MEQHTSGKFLQLWPIFMLLLAGAGVYAQQSGNGGLKESGHNRQKSQLIQLHEDNWQLMLKGEWMVEFFAPWCPACKNLAPTWERFASAAREVDARVAKIDVTTSPSLSGRFFVTALPTIYHVINGEFRQYRGSRDGDALMFFVKQKQWQKIEPISAWKKPDTIHMSILSYFFKLSHTLKDFNARLQEEYGMPTWGSYALFAVGTIFVGAALGLLLVCIVDFLYPPKKSQRQSFSEAKEKSLNAVEDLANDEIEDDAPQLDDAAEDEDEGEDEDDTEEEDDADASTSEGEKNSRSESEEPESEKTTKLSEAAAGDSVSKAVDDGKTTTTATTAAPSASPSEVRKRKPRKAD